jgi:phosphocarrier protein FPr
MASGSSLLSVDRVRRTRAPASKVAAIREAAQLLVAGGRIDPAYVESMLRREQVADTYLGRGVAIPHGMVEDRALIRDNGLAILQIPEGVTWNDGQTVRLVVAIAAQSDAHISILRRLTRLLQDEAALEAVIAAEDPAAVITALGETPAPAAPAAPASDLAETFEWVCDYPNGLHARPAAHWIETARRQKARVQVRSGDVVADPRNLVSLLQLGLRDGETVVVSAEGEGAGEALAAMKTAILSLTAQEKADAAKAAAKAAVVGGWTPPSALPALPGISASPGLAIGRVHVLRAAEIVVPDAPVDLVEGGAQLDRALDTTRQKLAAIADDTRRRLGGAEAAIFEAQAEFLADTDLVTAACRLMVEGHGAAWSWHQAVERTAASLAALGNPLLAARAVDLRDVGRRVLLELAPELEAATAAVAFDGPVILVADDLTPSDTAGLDTTRVVGLVTARGGPTSHTAILARTLGLPAIVAAGDAALDLAEGIEAVIDGGGARLWLEPDAASLEAARSRIAADAAKRSREAEDRAAPATTTDGRRFEIAANVNTPDQVGMAIDLGAEGVGLMRTEFLFLERGATPSEDEQYEIYAAMLDALGDRPLIVRALDIGGDKQVAHLDLPHEDNPFLGVRGARLLLRRPDLMLPQLRALYRAAKTGRKLLIMFPMITSVGEVIALRAVCERVRAELDAPVVPIGIMVEVPAAALMADVLAPHVDFFSIGTNDLTQYALAIDRQHPDLAGEADSLHPAVLRLIERTVAGAEAAGKWVGVCGGIAGDPFGASILAGLGVHELSMTPRDVAAVKARIRNAAVAELRALAEKALACESADQVRALEGAKS